MASIGKRGGGELVLESKHLLGLFLLLVVVFGVVFTLGYLMGRSQYDTKLSATKSSAAGVPASAASAKSKESPDAVDNLIPQGKSDFEFYHSAEPSKTEDHLQPPSKPEPVAKSEPFVAAVKSQKSAKPSKKTKSQVPPNAPLIPEGAIMLQVAAVQSQGDALALAQALQQKKFPAFVITPKADKYYRVQVGPYRDTQAATNARRDLEAKGFKSIVKR